MLKTKHFQSDDFFKSLDATEMTYLHTVCDLSVKDDKNGVRTLGTQDSKFVVENGVKETYSFQIKAMILKLSGLKVRTYPKRCICC